MIQTFFLLIDEISKTSLILLLGNDIIIYILLIRFAISIKVSYFIDLSIKLYHFLPSSKSGSVILNNFVVSKIEVNAIKFGSK